MSLSMAEQRKQADQQKKRPRSSEGPESSSRGGGKKSSAIVVAAAGPVVTKTPVLVAPSPFASKPPTTAASPIASKPPPTAASPIASKPPALAASSTTPKGAASSPVTSMPLALAPPPSPVASTPASPSPLAIMAPSSAPAIVKPGGEDRSVLEGDEQAEAGAMVAAEEEVFLPVKKKWFDCAVCSAPLKPPIFTCEDRHFVCSACAGGGGGGGGPNEYKYCGACHRAASFVHSSGMDALVDDTKVPCPHAKFGCERSIAYHETPDHAARCAHAPCCCPDPECPFEGDRAGLVRHLMEDSGRHRWPVVKIKYETSYAFAVFVPSPSELNRRLLVAEEDGGVFLLAVGTADDFCPVTVVCVRGNDDDARPLYVCTLWVDGPPAPASRFSGSFRLKAEVSSCAIPSEVDMKRSRLLAPVIPTMLHGKNNKIHLRLSIVRMP